MSGEQSAVQPSSTRTKTPAAVLFMVRFAVGLALLAGGAASANWLLRNWIPLSADLAAEHPEWAEQARLRVPLLPSEGKDRGRLPLVVAWDPTSAASTKLLGWLLARSEKTSSLVGQTRLVRLVAAPPEFDTRILDRLGALDHRELLGPALREGRIKVPLSADSLASLLDGDPRGERLLEREAANADIRQWIRTQARVAEGLGLRPGDMLLQGRRVPIAQLKSEASLDQELAVAQAEWETALGRAGGDTDKARESVLRELADNDPVVAERYRAWIVQGLKVKTGLGQ
ncbi:MAG: hypothetical protein HY902_09780 [Deltaproteobacteria bacterium]|nr:hypothetical protein [Deltaproteobacteria bacterium]